MGKGCSVSKFNRRHLSDKLRFFKNSKRGMLRRKSTFRCSNDLFEKEKNMRDTDLPMYPKKRVFAIFRSEYLENLKW